MAVWVRCKAGQCHFRTPDGKESDTLPPPRRKEGKKPVFVYDAQSDPKKKCAESCRCYIVAQRINKKTKGVEVETLYPADGNDEDALTEQGVARLKKEAEQAKTYTYEFVAACIEMVANAKTGKLEPKRA
jgi:hypothetical protein